MAELEPCALLAGSFNGTDIDGDTFTVTLSGPGDLTVTTSVANNQGFINTLNFANTTSSSTITVSVKQAGGGDMDKVSLVFLNLGIGEGRADVTVGGRVSSLSASKVDAELNLTRGAETIRTTVGELAAELNIPENALFSAAVKSIQAAHQLDLNSARASARSRARSSCATRPASRSRRCCSPARQRRCLPPNRAGPTSRSGCMGDGARAVPRVGLV